MCESLPVALTCYATDTRIRSQTASVYELGFTPYYTDLYGVSRHLVVMTAERRKRGYAQT